VIHIVILNFDNHNKDCAQILNVATNQYLALLKHDHLQDLGGNLYFCTIGRKTEYFSANKTAFPGFRQQEPCPTYPGNLRTERNNESVANLTLTGLGFSSSPIG